MKTYWKIIFIACDIITIGLGVPLLMGGVIRNLYFQDFGDIEIGAFMITLGLLLHYWRKNYFNLIKKEPNK